MNVTGLEQVPSMGTWIQEENVVSWLKLCSMYLLRIELSFGKRLMNGYCQFNIPYVHYEACLRSLILWNWIFMEFQYYGHMEQVPV